MKPNYDLEKIKLTVDEPTWKRAIDLYESGAISNFREDFVGFSARVQGTQLYSVSVSSKDYNAGNCSCYLGQNETLCKHMIAVAIMAVTGGRKLTREEKDLDNEVKSSGVVKELSPAEIVDYKDKINEALKYIKPYRGPSKIWFQYQDSLTEGCNRLAKIISQIPISGSSADIIVDLLLRLDRKLTTGGVDDSDGIVGGFIENCVEVLKRYAEIDKNCLSSFKKLRNKETCFGWEEPLLSLLTERPAL